MHFLITAGGTREYIDPVRFISNASSGKMGYAIAQAAMKAGHTVTLISASELQPPVGAEFVGVDSASEMFAAGKKFFPFCDCLIMAAAVADYTPVRYSKTKIKKEKKLLTIKLKPTIDILRWAAEQKQKNKKSKLKNKIVVGFALEDKNLKANAEKKLKEKNLDMIIANSPDSIGSDKTEVYVKSVWSEWKKFSLNTKEAIAAQLISLIEQTSQKQKVQQRNAMD